MGLPELKETDSRPGLGTCPSNHRGVAEVYDGLPLDFRGLGYRSKLDGEEFDRRLDAFDNYPNTDVLNEIGRGMGDEEGKELRKGVVMDYLGIEAPGKGHHRRLRQWLRANSVLASATMSNPGNNALTEFFYDYGRSGNEPATRFDRLMAESPLGKAVADRIDAVKGRLGEYIQERIDADADVAICNMFSGPGTDVIETIYDMKKGRGHLPVSVVNLDIDREALEEGRSYAEELGIGKYLDFVPFNLGTMGYSSAAMERRAKSYTGRHDIGLVIGVLCSQNNGMSAMLMKRLRSFLKSDGVMIASSASKRMQEEQSFVNHVMKMGGWRLYYKTDGDMEEIMERSGYSVLELFHDEPYRYHVMCAGTPDGKK